MLKFRTILTDFDGFLRRELNIYVLSFYDPSDGCMVFYKTLRPKGNFCVIYALQFIAISIEMHFLI